MKQKINFPYLKKSSLLAWILKLLPIPIGIISARLMAILLSYAIEGDIKSTLIAASIILFGAIFVKIFDMIMEVIYQNISNRAIQKSKLDLYERFYSNSLDKLYISKQGDIMENFNDDFHTMIQKNLSIFPAFGAGILTLFIYSLALAQENMYLMVALLCISFIQMIPPIIIKKYMQVNYDNCREIEAKITDFSLETYQAFATVKLYHLKVWWIKQLEKYHKEYEKIGRVATYTGAAKNAMETFLDNLLKYGTYFIIGIFILKEFVTIEGGIQAITLSGGLYGAVKSIFSCIPQFAVVKTAQSRIAKWYFYNNYDKSEDKIPNAIVKFSDVSFSYQEEPIFHHVNVIFETNKIITIKGANGIGKSTLFKLITGLLSCDNGEIFIGDIRVDKICDTAYLSTIFYLSQEDPLFDFSTKELYQMLPLENAEEAVENARKFHLSEEELQTQISSLSGGERKKVFLAFAFARNPKILLLDEPTNSLDEDSKMVLKMMLKNRNGGTMMITHDTIFDDMVQGCYHMRKGGIFVEE